MLAPAALRAENLSDFFFASAAAHASLPVQRRRQGSGFSSITYREAAEQVRCFAAGLTLLGVRRGDRVGLISENWDRWLLADLAILACGAADVPCSSRLTGEELAMTLAHAGCRFILVAGPEELARVSRMRRHLPGLVEVVDLSDGRDPRHTVRSFSELSEAGRTALDQGRLPEGFPAPNVGRGDLATIVYTSGTTGRPKGVMLTHGNILSNIAAILTIIKIREGESLLSILPSWHMYERTVEYAGLGAGAEIVYSSLRTLKDDLRQVRPGFFASVPRLWAGIHERAMAAIAEAPPLRRRLALAAWSAGTRAVLARRVLAGEPAPGNGPQRPGKLRALLEYLAFTPILHLVTRRLVFRRVRAATGGRLRGALSGGATLSMDLDLFFEVVGLRLLNGYGLTETSPVLTCRRFSHNLPGTVGRPLPGTEVRIVDEKGGDRPAGRQGRILVRGPQVMRGYYRDPEATAAVLDREGWFDTGDLGRFLASGDLVLTGRLKDTIVLANGENVEPELIEERIKSSRYVDQVMAVGQDRDYLAVLVVPAFAELRSWARRHGRPDLAPADLVDDPEIQNLMRRQVARRAGSGSGCRPAEVVKKVHLLPREFSVDDGTLTPTLKVRRAAVLRLYRREIDDLFQRSSS